MNPLNTDAGWHQRSNKIEIGLIPDLLNFYSLMRCATFPIALTLHPSPRAGDFDLFLLPFSIVGRRGWGMRADFSCTSGSLALPDS